MPQTQYNLHLKGFVGGADFDRNYVDYILAKNAGKEVNVLIDSLGGNLATALYCRCFQEPRQGQRSLRRHECFRRYYRFARRGSHLH